MPSTPDFLFYGPPGCGKTATAGAVALELGLPFPYVNYGALINSYLGCTAKNIKTAFDSFADGSYAVVFDEFDTLAASRVRIAGRDGDEPGS
ncbi:MAG: ATP-binding protein [Deltaproteobacteria bacterium]|nr:ATP-binding protein [Deltaproteobacteria bacterium]